MIMPQEPKEGLYICVDNSDSCVKPLEDTKGRIVIGTPLQFLEKTDSDQYLFIDAEGNQWQMSAYNIECCLRKIPNRLPNRKEKLLRWFYEFNKYADDFKNPSHMQFTLLGAELCFVPQFVLDLAIIALVFGLVLPVQWLFFAVIPWIPNLCFWIVRRKKKVCGEFLLILKSPYRNQMLTELMLLLKCNELKEKEI